MTNTSNGRGKNAETTHVTVLQNEIVVSGESNSGEGIHPVHVCILSIMIICCEHPHVFDQKK